MLTRTLGLTLTLTLSLTRCAADGANSQRALCTKEDIAGYPTWQIDGKLHSPLPYP